MKHYSLEDIRLARELHNTPFAIGNVEHGVPIEPIVKHTKTSKYPFGLLNIGDSFTIHGMSREKIVVLTCRIKRGTNRNYWVGQPQEGGFIRVWRTA